MAVEISTYAGKVIIATLYQPLNRSYIPILYFITLFKCNIPVYMIDDLNATHPLLGYQHTNTKGRQINALIQNTTTYCPQFPYPLHTNTGHHPGKHAH